MKKRLLGVVLAGVGVVGMTATPSFAAAVQYSISDPRWDQSHYGSKASLAQKEQADIVRLTYGRDAAGVWVRVKMRDLHSHIRQPDIFFHGTHSRYQMVWDPVLGTHPQLINRSGDVICGRNGTVHVNYSANFIQMSFPKSCFRKGYLMLRPAVDASYFNPELTTEIDDTAGLGHSFYPNP